MFIFAKMRESNFKERSDDELQGSYRGSHPSDGDHGSCEDTSGHLREWETQENANPEYFGGSAFRPYYWSCNHFIRPEESFLGRVFTSGFSPPVANGGTPDWMRGVLPPERTVMLSTSFGPGAGGAVCGNSSCKGRRSSSGGCCASSPGPSMVSPVARKMVRFRCHTCAEKLPTLNSLRTHLKSHSRPATLNLPVALRSDQHFVPSTVVTSKYGRRRAVVSALVAMKPGPLRR